MVLDDIDSRAGSTVSLLRTFVGLHLRDLGGWISVQNLVRLMQAAGVSEAATRNGIVTLKQKALLLPEKKQTAGYSLNEKALLMLERGDAKIFGVRQMHAEEKWGVFTFSVAESERAKRLRLRARLRWIGCGQVAAGVWITPEHLLGEVREILAEHKVQAVIFLATDPEVAGGFVAASAKWWDIENIKQTHLDFLDYVEKMPDAGGSLGAAFAAHLQLVDQWRSIPYIDPGLPERILPADWPGEEAQKTFHSQHARYQADSKQFIATITNGP